ncbi:MAG: aminotransferase class V-fold PLP-dependent enzyme, partial [Pseudomonadota bacterium]
MTFDVYTFRAQFPILEKEVYGKPLVYLDNAASVQKPQVMIDAMTSVMTEGYANVHRGLHALSNDATQKFEDARLTARKYLGAADSQEIIFT